MNNSIKSRFFKIEAARRATSTKRDNVNKVNVKVNVNKVNVKVNVSKASVKVNVNKVNDKLNDILLTATTKETIEEVPQP